MTTCSMHHFREDRDDLAHWIAEQLPAGSYKRICIKPNWVLHEQTPAFPISAMVTSPILIEACIVACLEKYPDAKIIDVGDVPLQSCEFALMLRQSGANRIARLYAARPDPKLRFTDWRRERFIHRNGYLEKDARGGHGDPEGYREVVLDDRSFLDPISSQSNSFRVSDYNPDVVKSSHRHGFHRYLVAGSALAAELIVNLPKMKTHQKAGITGALKNLVGINGEKGSLVHHRKGFDEFAPGTSALIPLQCRLREMLQKRSQLAFGVGRLAWRALKRIRGIQTELHRAALQNTDACYVAAGSWYGNDSVWRMIYDLNQIVRFVSPEGGFPKTTPQRDYIAIVDGIVAGEGNGPLQPLPVEANLVWSSQDPFAADMLMASLMGFDWSKIPSLSHHREFPDSSWGQFEPANIIVSDENETPVSLNALTPVKRFLPPPGWQGHIEDSP